MSRFRLASTVLVGIAVVGLALAQDRSARERPSDDKESSTLPKCPLMGKNTVNLAKRIVTEEGPVYFCCNKCVGKAKKDASSVEGVAAKQEEVLKKLPRVQVTCPVSGEPVSADSSTKYEGTKVNFCCDDCKDKFEKEPAKYSAKLAASYTYQTQCAVMPDDPIDPSVSIEIGDGQHVYFCCKNCIPKFKSDPEKYSENLKKQGYDYGDKALAKIKSDGD